MLVLAALGVALAGGAMVEEPPKLNVTGVGEVYVPPDEAVLTLGVRAQATTASAAFDEAAALMQAVVTAVGKSVPEERIRTNRLSLEPRYDYTGNRQRLIGYEAAATIEIRVDDPMNVGTVLDAAVAAGANDVAGIAWVVEDEDAARQQALDAAVADARANAEQVAGDLGIDLGQPLSVHVRSMDSGMPPTYYYERAGADEDAAMDMPVLAGEQIYRAEVDVSFRIEEGFGTEPGDRPEREDDLQSGY